MNSASSQPRYSLYSSRRAVLDAAGTRVATVERGSLPLPGVENPPELLAIVDEGER